MLEKRINYVFYIKVFIDFEMKRGNKEMREK